MNEILKDLNNPHWWFDLLVGLLLTAVGFALTEFVIKPFGKFAKNYKRRSKLSIENNVAQVADLLEIKADPQEEMRMHFTLIYVRQTISLKLFLLILSPFLICVVLFIESWPVKIAGGLIGFWFIISTFIDLIRLMRYQNYYMKILLKIKSDNKP